jgi:catechol 2,3-dioxygenase-like lactoylglutathione lyase family enzyme
MYRVVTLVLLALATTGIVPSSASSQLAAPNPTGVSWGHIHLNVTDPDEHTRIWTEHFGGRVVDLDLVRTISLPNTVVMLNERAPSGGTSGSSLDHFGFSVPDVAAFLERWRADGLEVESEFEGFGGLPQAYLLLPDGIRVELEQIPTLGYPAVPYHVHVYTAGDAEALRDEFVERFGLTPRPRGSNPFTADAPGMNVSFTASEGPVAPTRGRAVDHIGFEVEGLEAFARELAEQGVAFDVEYRVLEEVGVAIAFFSDASGTTWELTEGLDGLAALPEPGPVHR